MGRRMDLVLTPTVYCGSMGNLCLFTILRPLLVVSHPHMLQAVPLLGWIKVLQHRSNNSTHVPQDLQQRFIHLHC